MLTADNLPKLKNQIAEFLVPTFRDAINVSKCLNIRYLWIGALCILQRGEGSAQDWIDHTTAMRDVCTHYLINISADRAAGAGDGFLMPCSLDLVSPVIVDHPKLSVHRIVDLGLAHTCISRSPLAQRAWVLQERCFPARVPHFTAQQAFWECVSTTLASEAFLQRVPLASDCGAYFSAVRKTMSSGVLSSPPSNGLGCDGQSPRMVSDTRGIYIRKTYLSG